MPEAASAATRVVIAALDAWRAKNRRRRYPRLAISEVLDRAASNHCYLAVTFAHRGDWHGWDVKPIADSFLTWLMQARPDLGGPHLAFLTVRSDLEEDDPQGIPPPPPVSDAAVAGLRRHAREFAVGWLDLIPFAHNICLDDGELDDPDEPNCVRIVETNDPAAEVQLRADVIARILALRYDQKHPDLAWKIHWREADAFLKPRSEGGWVRRPPLLPEMSLDHRAVSTPALRHAHARDFADAWLRLIPFEHPIYIAERFESDPHGGITVRVVRDDVDSEHTLDELAVAQTISDRYARMYPEESAWVVWIGEYCK